jgi:hypothetical protein
MAQRLPRRIFAFNGDADGLCALQQLRWPQAQQEVELVTGPKRRTRLLATVSAGPGDAVTVLDVSLDANRGDVERLLAAGAALQYFDHHYPGALPQHERFFAVIDTAPGVCTSSIVDRHLHGRLRAWAAVGAYGDNLLPTARALARQASVSEADAGLLERLGMLLNYNAYGESEQDLHFAPADLHRRMLPHADPLAFAREDPAFTRLAEGYASDMERAARIAPALAGRVGAVYVLPDAAWARRVSGVLANRLAQAAPAQAHALLSPNGAGGMQVSVRAPLARPTGAAALCLGFAGGGGRESAAGINHLPLEELDSFTARFMEHFST